MNFLQQLRLENAPADIMLPLLSCLERRGLNLNSPDDQLFEAAMDYLAEEDVNPDDVEQVDDNGQPFATSSMVEADTFTAADMAEVAQGIDEESMRYQEEAKAEAITQHSSWVTD